MRAKAKAEVNEGMRSREKQSLLWISGLEDECITTDHDYDFDYNYEGFLPLDDTLRSKASVRSAGRLSSRHPVSMVSSIISRRR